MTSQTPTPIDCRFPVDAILRSGSCIVLGCYSYQGDSTRTGEILFLDAASFQPVSRYATPGTFSICQGPSSGSLYAANAGTVISLTQDGITAESETGDRMNTAIVCSHGHVYSVDTDGWLTVWTPELSKMEEVRISSDTLWCIEQARDKLIMGGEDGQAYAVSISDHVPRPVGEKRSGIIEVAAVDDEIWIASYDGNIEIYDQETLTRKKRIEGVGAAWRIVVESEYVYCACMYDGLRVFDKKFNLLREMRTESICYGLLVEEERVLWSSFYQSVIFHMDKKVLLGASEETGAENSGSTEGSGEAEQTGESSSQGSEKSNEEPNKA